MSTIIRIPIFSDNYIWLLCNESKKTAAIIDPGIAQPVIDILTEKNIVPTAILITHHHYDHTAGILDLLNVYPNLSVYGPKNEFIPHLTHTVGEGDLISLDSFESQLTVFDTPGHTAGHIAYYIDDNLFCGDTLFVNGCGRVFDGTVMDLHHSLNKLAQLPANTKIYCSHEFTIDNLGFAKWVEKDNMDLLLREKALTKLKKEEKSTVPSVLYDELKTNPFLRCDNPAVIEKAEQYAGRSLHSSLEVFATLRLWKDREYD